VPAIYLRLFKLKSGEIVAVTPLRHNMMRSVFQVGHDACSLLLFTILLCSVNAYPSQGYVESRQTVSTTRERLSINSNWKFSRFTTSPDSLSYNSTLKSWILPSANDFIVDGSKHTRPSGTAPGADVQYVQASFNDASWESLNLPHDWAIKGPFRAPGISGGMGRLPSNGIGWYRRNLTLEASDVGKSIFLDIDGAMSYSAVWVNGKLVGGWPYGYASFRLDLTSFLKVGTNILAIRLENALNSSRWYPGAGIYRNVWLVKVNPIHVGQFGTRIRTPSVSAQAATVEVGVDVENKGTSSQEVTVVTEIRLQGSDSVVAKLSPSKKSIAAGTKLSVNGSVAITNPMLWGPPPTQKPNLYVATTTVLSGNSTIIDTYETKFGIRSVAYDANKGLLVNGQRVRVQGTNNHHDLGSIGSAFNYRAAERQLEMLAEMGCNALRMSHNPPAAELLDLADLKGFLVIDEAFDVWNQKKENNDYHLLFSDWHEPDLRSFIRRDLNHPSVIVWSIGNEIPEQRNDQGAATGRILKQIVREEDPTRPSTSALNNAGPGQGISNIVDLQSLNYQGEGNGNSWSSSFPQFHSTYPNQMLWTSESASTLSTRGGYIFPVVANSSGVIGDGSGGNSTSLEASGYELYGPSWGASPDKVFAMQDKYPYVAGEFVWTGFDYIGEPTPYGDVELARSSYFGIIDLAGFKKDRFFLYQARWREDLPTAHILPHWSWPSSRVGQVTPVHVFSSGDEAELFVNGKSAGRVKKEASNYRFRWDRVTYAPGDLRVVTYKKGAVWAEASKKTVGATAALNMTADRTTISADGYDLSFITVAVVDKSGESVPYASDNISFTISGPGKIVATDNGSPIDQTPFPSLKRNALYGFALAIVRSNPGEAGDIIVSASANGLVGAKVTLHAVSS